MSNKKDNNEPKFNEYQAYEELRMIIAIAIETQNFASLEPNIALWEHRYPLEDFVDQELVRKIKAILNKDYLSRLIGDYLASQVLHEQQKQQKAYEDLKAIIDKAKKTKDYKTAEQKVKLWKASLVDNDMYLYDFNKIYTKQIFKMLLLPSKELANQKEASDSLKRLVDQSKNMDSASLEEEISSWQNKFSLDTFPDKLKKELNTITADVAASITLKRSEENAISELKSYVTSDSFESPSDEIPKLLSKYDLSSFSDSTRSQIDDLTCQAMTLFELSLDSINSVIEAEGPTSTQYIPPVQQQALYDLKEILSQGGTKNTESIFEWIYLNRKIDFTPEAKEEMKALFSMAGFSKPTSGSYTIPSLDTKIENLKQKDVVKIRESVILNYIGIIYSEAQYLSEIDQERISTLRNKQEVISVTQSSSNSSIDEQSDVKFVLPVSDNIDPTISEKEAISNAVTDEMSQKVLHESPEEIDILVEDLLKDPLESIDLQSSKKQKKDAEPEELDKNEVSAESQIVQADETVEIIETDAEADDKIISTDESVEFGKKDQTVPDEHDEQRNIIDEHVSLFEEQDEYNSTQAEMGTPVFKSDLEQETFIPEKISIPEETDIDVTTSSTLAQEDQDLLENINYMTTTYDIQNIRISHRKKTKFLSQNYIEKIT